MCKRVPGATDEVSNIGTDKSQLANMANQAKAALEAESLEAFADRGYFKGEETCSPAEILSLAGKPEERCEAQFYIGEWQNPFGDRGCPTGSTLLIETILVLNCRQMLSSTRDRASRRLEKLTWLFAVRGRIFASSTLSPRGRTSRGPAHKNDPEVLPICILC